MRRIRIVLLLVFFVLHYNVVSAKRTIKVVNFTVSDGLPRNIVNCFLTDDYGYGWVGTRNGLAKFNGYSFNTYLSGYNIFSMQTNSAGDLFVATDVGMFLYNRVTDDFMMIRKGYSHRLTIYHDTAYFLSGKQFQKIVDNKSVPVEFKKITNYLLTDHGMWYCLNNDLRVTIKDTVFLKGEKINEIKEIDNQIFILTRKGKLYKTKSDTIAISRVDIDNHHGLFDIEKVGNEYWVATDGNGIIVLDKFLRIKKHIVMGSDKYFNLPNNSIHDIYPNKGIVWLSTYGSGLVGLIKEQTPFTNIVYLPNNSNSLVAKEGSAMLFDKKRCILGTNYGFSVYHRKTKTFTNYNINKVHRELNGAKIRGIVKDKQGYYWIGTYDGLLGKYNREFKLVETYAPFSKDKTESQKIIHMFNIDGRFILISSLKNGGEVVRLDTRNGKCKTVETKINPNNIFFQVKSVRRNRADNIIVLVNRKGLYQYLPQKNMLYPITPEINKHLGLVVNDFYHDNSGNYWIATRTKGILKFSPDGTLLDSIDTQRGLKTNTVLRLESTDSRYLWASTISGLINININTGNFQIFDKKHGLSCNEFLEIASAKNRNGKIIFGCTEGFVKVNTQEVSFDTSHVDVVISDILLQNKSIRKYANLIDKPLERTHEIVLPFDKNSLKIEFFANDNNIPKYNNYAYRLKEVTDNWIMLGDENYINLNALQPGIYTLQIRSTNKSNIWNKKYTELVIKILPPWYKTKLAYTLYIVFIGLLFWVFLYLYKKRMSLEYELDKANYKAEQEQELTERKFTFFTNISHDLKTAASLISAPVNDLLEADGLNPEHVKKLRTIKRNAERLYKLNNDLLEFRKITKQQLPLRVSEVEMSRNINDIFEAFTQECEKKDIRYILKNSVNKPVFVDVRKVEKILFNLISNAVKYTPSGGEIVVNASIISNDQGNYVILKVEDTGVGISKNKLEKIFERFYQIEGETSSLTKGVGIGLYIVKELASIHHGRVEVLSEEGKGSVFTVLLPCEEHVFSASEMAETEPAQQSDIILPQEDDNVDDEENIDIERKYNRIKIVIAEDSDDMREYLVDHFSKYYTVDAIDNGADAIELINRKEPDVIISDVNMPGLTGYELCDKIKTNFNTSHIPVILLTANSTLDDKIKGMYVGADSYITKPFEVKYLDAVVQSIVHNRKKLREKFLGLEPVKEVEKDKASPQDVEFVNSLKEFILNNLSESQLSIDLLVKEFAVSRSQLNRKIKALTGMTPNNYIKTLRLKKAYELLKDKDNRVTDVAFETGFTDPNYFTICFKKEFGKNPSQV